LFSAVSILGYEGKVDMVCAIGYPERKTSTDAGYLFSHRRRIAIEGRAFSVFVHGLQRMRKEGQASRSGGRLRRAAFPTMPVTLKAYRWSSGR
jgi:hypothetical protein